MAKMLSLLSKQASLVIAIGFICHCNRLHLPLKQASFDDEVRFISNV